MKICVDARGLNWYKGTGIGTYTYNLLVNMINLNREDFYHIFWSGGDYDSFHNDKTKILMASKKHQRFFESYYIPSFVKKELIDIYHIPQNGIGLEENIDCKKVVTIHDLIPYILPETVGKGYLKKFLTTMPKIMDNSHGILTVSNYSKKDILRFFPEIDEDDVFVTPLAANENYRPLNKDFCKKHVQEKYGINTPFFLYLGGFSSRKNVKGLILAFEKAFRSFPKERSLLIIGSLREEGEKLKQLVQDKSLQKNIVFGGFCENSDLPVLYNACEAFVYPSLYEGFGLPPLEAMSCATPVITSNITSIPEVVGDSGLLINPLDILDISNALVKISEDSNLSEDLSIKGLERSKYYSWENTAKETLKAYNKINEKYLFE